MIAATGLRWLVTVVFVAAGVFCLYRCVRHGSVLNRVNDLLHVLMCAAMIAMAWPVGMGFARVPQIVLFTIAAVWFVGMLVVGRHRHAGHHAVMMAAMAGMVFAMPLAMGGGIAAASEAGGEHAAHMAGSGGLSGAQLPGPLLAIAVVLAVVLLVVGIRKLAHALDTARANGGTLRAAGSGVDAAMSLGMALMIALLI